MAKRKKDWFSFIYFNFHIIFILFFVFYFSFLTHYRKHVDFFFSFSVNLDLCKCLYFRRQLPAPSRGLIYLCFVGNSANCSEIAMPVQELWLQQHCGTCFWGWSEHTGLSGTDRVWPVGLTRINTRVHTQTNQCFWWSKGTWYNAEGKARLQLVLQRTCASLWWCRSPCEYRDPSASSQSRWEAKTGGV